MVQHANFSWLYWIVQFPSVETSLWSYGLWWKVSCGKSEPKLSGAEVCLELTCHTYIFKDGLILECMFPDRKAI